MSSEASDGSNMPTAWLKRVRHSGEYSDVTVRVALEEFKLHLLPLLSDSTYFQEHVFAFFQKHVVAHPALPGNQDPRLVVDLPDFPGGPEIFQVVVDHWYGSLEDKISTSNVAKVICASDFLGVESLKNRAFKFLEENVFNCWKRCLAMLATFDCEEDPPIEDELFDRCADAFLDKIKTNNPLNLPDYPDCSMFCNVTQLLTVVVKLPVKMARLIYEWILAEEPKLFYRVEGSTKPSAILFCTAEQSKVLVKSEFNGDWISWVEQVPELLPDLDKRAMFLAGLCDLMTRAGFCSEDYVRMSFLCSLLVKVVEASVAMVSRGMPRDGLGLIINNAESLVGMNMDQVQSDVLQKCQFSTILAMVKRVKSWWKKDSKTDHVDELQRHIVKIAKVLDACLVAHLNQGSLSMTQVLIIYQSFPNDARSSHVDLYKVFKEVLQRKSVSFEQRHEISQILDFEKLPDACVQRMFQELEVDHVPRLLKRVLEIHEKHAKQLKINQPFGSITERTCNSFLDETSVLVKHFNVLIIAEAELKEMKDEDHSVKLSFKLQLQQAAVELTALRDEKLKLAEELQVKDTELIAMRDEKLRLESEIGDQAAKAAAVVEENMKLTSNAVELIAVNEENIQLRRELDAVWREFEQERDEQLCQICFERPKDAQCLPCKHFLYCCTCLNQHIQQTTTCPTCRTPCTGVYQIS